VTQAKLPGLKPSTRYRITIKARTAAGEGQEYFIEETTGKEGARNKPDPPSFAWDYLPPQFDSETGGLGSGGSAGVRITWLPNSEGEPGSHFFVQYRSDFTLSTYRFSFFP
jgi:hypothetical protein